MEIYRRKRCRNKAEIAIRLLQSASCGQAPIIIACCADIKAFGEFPERVEELIAAGALPEKTREVFIPSLKKGGMSADIKWHLLIAATGNTDIAIEHMALQAVELGLGTCWVRWFDDNKVKETLEIPKNIEIIALLPIGYPAEDPPQRPRFGLDKIVYYEKYSEKSLSSAAFIVLALKYPSPGPSPQGARELSLLDGRD